MTKCVTNKIKFLLSISSLFLACSFTPNAAANKGLQIKISDLSNLQEHTKTIREIQLSIAGRDYALQLWPSNTTQSIQGLQSKHFKGKVVGDNESWVRLSYLDNQLSGHMKAFGELLKIQTSNSQSSEEHFARKISSTDLNNYSSGTDRVLQAPPLESSKQIVPTQFRSRELTSKNVTRIMRLSIAIDSRFNDYYSGRGLEVAVSAINSVDGLFQEQFGLAIKLNSVVLFDKTNDPFLNYNGNIEQTLRAFRHYSLDNKNFSKNQTAVHLFSGTSDDDNIIGLSWINTACRSDGYNASASIPYSEQMLLTAHELAHNLGAVHDNDKSCEIEHNQVMWPNISSATTSRFSDCSKSAIIPKLNASCNLDNIDVGISLALKNSATIESQTEMLSITAYNKHTYSQANDIRSATLIQDGISVKNLPDECFQLANSIYCNHGDIKALSTNNIEIDIHYSTSTTQIVKSEIDAPSIIDITNDNDSATLDLNNPDENTGVDIDELNTPSTDASVGGSAGSPGILFILNMLLISVVRRMNFSEYFYNAAPRIRRNSTQP